MEKNEKGKSGDGFIDRSKVRILLCDNDEKSSEEVFTLLCKCSYQVTCVKSPRQVIDALNAEGPNIDIILSEVDLPMSKGFKMLKYITRDKELRRIPVIMMSAQDEVSIVVKCLKFGAADYLVKPLRTNELLNLWTHMWRRRRMLGLAEKNIVNYDIDLVLSDPSDANTSSTTLFSDDTYDKPQKSTNPEPYISKHQEYKNNAVIIATPIETIRAPSGSQPDYMSATSSIHTGPISPFAKSELKIGESSAFFMYVKSTTPKTNNLVSSSIHEKEPQQVSIIENLPIAPNVQGRHNSVSFESHSRPDDLPSSNSISDSYPTEPSCTQQKKSNEDFAQVPIHFQNDTPTDVHGYYSHNMYSYYIPGIMSHQVQMQQNHVPSTMFSHYNHIPQCPPGMASYNPYYPFGICLQPGQMPMTHQWQSFVNSSAKVDRRKAALVKFRQKRKERCFDKKIRYVNRKKLAERRLRVRGKFVRKVNGVNVDLNGQPADEGEEDEEDYDEEDQSANTDFSPEEDASNS